MAETDEFEEGAFPPDVAGRADDRAARRAAVAAVALGGEVGEGFAEAFVGHYPSGERDSEVAALEGGGVLVVMEGQGGAPVDSGVLDAVEVIREPVPVGLAQAPLGESEALTHGVCPSARAAGERFGGRAVRVGEAVRGWPCAGERKRDPGPRNTWAARSALEWPATALGCTGVPATASAQASARASAPASARAWVRASAQASVPG